MKKTLSYLLASSTLIVLAACSGSGSTSSNNNGGGGNQGDAAQLTFVAPNIVPSLPTASTSYVVVNNPTNSVVTGVKYQLGNIVGGASNVTLDPASSANCATVAANSSCTFKLITTANSLAGSFSLSASNSSLLSRLTNKTTTVNKKSLAANLPTTPTIGVQQVAYTTTTGANGITLYYFNTVVAGVPMIMVTGVVSSNQTGNLNTVTLLDGNGNPLPNQQVISGNMGAGAASLGMGSTFSILLPAPTGSNASQTIGVKTEQIAANGTISNPQVSSNTSTLSTASGVAIVNMLPSSIYLTESNPSQQVTFSNTGDATAQLQSLIASNPNIEVVFSSANLAPGSTVTATLRLKDTSVPAASSSITLSYNNGQSDQSQSSNVDQNVVPGPDPIPVPPPGPTPAPGLTAAFANNNFNVTTVNHITFESMTITNTGNTTESNFVVTMPNSNFSLVDNVGSATDCAVTSGAIALSQSLESSTNCTVTVKYENTTVGSGTGNISIAYKYNNGTTAPTPATAAVNWKVSQSTANLVITGDIANPYIFPTTLSDGSGESSTYLFSIKNTGEVAATDISSVVNSTTLAGLFTTNNTDADPAACGVTLDADTSCQLGVQFGSIPDNTSAGTKNGDLTISYKEYDGATTSSSLVQNVQGQVANSGSAIFNAPSSGTATGFTDNTWSSLTIDQNATTGVITYTLTNTGTDAATNFIVTLPSAPTGWTSIATTCPTTTGTNLAPQASCNVTLTADAATAGTIAATNFTLGLAWSDQDSPNGETQNMQITTPAMAVVVPTPTPYPFLNPIAITLNPDGTYAFIVSYDANEVIQCSVNNGTLSNCANSGATELDYPTAITLNPNGTIAFITNRMGSVAQCYVNNGTLAGCNRTAFGLNSGQSGITLNPAGTYAFITNSSYNTVTQCSVNNGAFSNCANSGATGLANPQGITLNPAGTYAFIVNNDDEKVTQCSVSGGRLSNCTNSGATELLFPRGIALNPAGTYAFITNEDSDTVTQCSVNNGTLGNCADSGATGLDFPQGITLNPAGTYAFITNLGDSTVTQCSVNGGTLSNCAQTGFQ